MKTFTNGTNILLIVMFVLVQACGALPASSEGFATEQPSVAQPTQPPIDEPEESVLPVPQSNVVPVSLPESVSGHAGDQVSALDKAISGGDRFTYGQFERPFNSESMDVYFPSLDIVDTLVHQDGAWIYGSIQLNALEGADVSADKYALELDTDRDGRGDWLVIVSNPASADWTVLGVQVYNDANDDIGSLTPMFTDEGATGDGFETIVFDQGAGSDPEGAWVRISPDNPNLIQIAVKRAVVGNPQTYMISMWAGHSLLDPALFDLNDAFSHEQAGAANPGYELYYPIKSVFELDSSCRMAVGFQPAGTEPGLCNAPIQYTIDEPPAEVYNQPACPPCPPGTSLVKDYPDCECVG
ncbi:MAG: hypothetical protein JETCAE01_08180 [Anaerolineaceae bacterium]|nr:MAG: hypothetical protein JETCAE01_08180 [Anaerolineaceae bacterium]